MAMQSTKFKENPQKLGELLEAKTLLDDYDGIEGLCAKLDASLDTGLQENPEMLKIRRDYFGENFIPPKMPHSYFYYLFKAFQDLMLIFLLIGGLIVFITEMVQNPSGGGVDGVAILSAVIIIVVVTSVNDYTKELKFKNLHKTIKLGNTCTIMREGRIFDISTKDLVVGDVYLPKYGDQVPADCVIFEETGLKTEESSITGESELVKKDIKNKPYLLASTYINEGSGKALVVAVGYYAQTGRILKLLGVTKQKKKVEKSDTLLQSSSAELKKKERENQKCRSILQEKLNRLALLIGKIGVGAGISVFAILSIRFCVRNYTGSESRGFAAKDLLSGLQFLIIGFTVLVVAVPEGLPLAVNLALAYSVSKMLKDNNLVRQLYSCETMGNATTICSDKTGTLTTNRMTVLQIFVMGTNSTNLSINWNLPSLLLECLCMNICFNKSPSSTLQKSKTGEGPSIQMGNRTDCALLGFLDALKIDFKDFVKKYPKESIIKVFPFNSNKKLMTAILDVGEGKYRVIVKGAPDVLLEKCTQEFIDHSGIIGELSSLSLKKIQTVISEMASNSLRTILLAFKDIDAIEIGDDFDESQLINCLVMIGMVGIEDPLRPDVPEAIKLCNRAGITVRMVTGDNLITAKSIASKCGIITGEKFELMLDSQKFNQLIRDKKGNFDQDLFDKVWPKLKVLARSSPSDKYILVNGILNTNLPDKQIVAVTGDGTNDAPALKRADVGFAMGLTGTDIAKEACDIIITDDNFSNIVKAICWGRNVYDSISKFIQFQLTVNFAAILLSIITSIFFDGNVFKASQLLWVNLVMDTFASLALATDSPTPDVIDRKPYTRNKSLLSKNMCVFIAFHTFYQVAVILIIVFLGPTLFSLDNEFYLNHYLETIGTATINTSHTTFIFNIFVIMQIFNEINARKVHGERNVFSNIFVNKIFIGIIVLTIFVQVLIIQFGYGLFHVVPLNPELWMYSILIGFSVLIYHQLVVINVPYLISIPKKYRFNVGIPSSVVICEEPKPFDAKLYWIRGLKKLQQEIRVVNAFKTNLDIARPMLTQTFQSQQSLYYA